MVLCPVGGPDSPVVVTINVGGACPAPGGIPIAVLIRFSGGGSSFIQAFSNMFVHLPLVP